MSLSRQIALVANDEEKYREAMSAIARNLIASGRSTRNWFEGVTRPVLHALHAGGFDKDKLRELRHVARQEFQRAKAVNGMVPAEPQGAK